MGNDQLTRFNFLVEGRTFRPTFQAPRVASRIRAPLGALFASAGLACALYIVQIVRLHDIDQSYRLAQLRLSESEIAVHAIKALHTEVAKRWTLAAAVVNVQRSGLRRANELASIGNRLPHDAWLSSIRYDATGYALDGKSQRIAAVGAAMTALARKPNFGVPHLLAISDDGGVDSKRIHYALRLEQAKP